MKSQKFLSALCLLLFFVSAISLQARTAEEVNNYLQQTVIPDFTVENMPALDALDQVQKLGSLNQYGIYFEIVAKDKVKKGSVTLSLKNAPIYDVLQMIASLCNVQMKIRKDQVLFFDPGSKIPLQE